MTDVSTFSATSSMLTGGIPRPVDHTPKEKEFQMVLIPSTRIIFMDANIGVTPVTVFVTLHNTTSLIQAFKVKCTANNMFTIKPSHGIISPNEKKKVYNMAPREIFEIYKPEGVKRIQCQFKNADGQPIHPADPKPNTETVTHSLDQSTCRSPAK